MKFLKVTLAAAAMSVFAMTAQAQDSNAYINLGLQTFEFDTYNIVGRAGYKVSPNFGVEVEGSVGISSDDIDDDAELSTPFSVGAYIVTSYPVSEKFELFGRVGYANVNVEVEAFGESDDSNFDGFSTGGGIQYNFSEKNGLRFDYTTLLAGGGSADILDLTFVRKF